MTAPVPPVRVAYLVAWLRAHQGEFTEEALRGRLLEAGHLPADVEAAFVQLGEAEPAAPTAFAQASAGADGPPLERPPAVRAQQSAHDRDGDTVLGVLGGLAALVGLPMLLAQLRLGSAVGPAVFIALAFVVVGWAGFRHSGHPGVAKGLGIAVLLAVLTPVVAVVGIFGYCLVAGGRVN